MPDRKNTDMETAKAPYKMDSVAEAYLDLWQENARRWSTDPDALEKWAKEMARQKKNK